MTSVVREITESLIFPEFTGRDYNFKWCSVALQDRFKELEKKKESGKRESMRHDLRAWRVSPFHLSPAKSHTSGQQQTNSS